MAEMTWTCPDLKKKIFLYYFFILCVGVWYMIVKLVYKFQCVHVRADVCLRMCAEVRCLTNLIPQLLSTLFYEAQSLHKPGAP